MIPNLAHRALSVALVLFMTAVLWALTPSASYACTGVVSAAPAGSDGPMPPEGPPAGTALDVTGSGFAPGPVVVRWGASDGPVLGRTTTDGDGRFSLEVVVPRSAAHPPRIVAVSARPGSSGLPSTGWVDVGAVEPAGTTPGETPAAAGAGEERPVGGVLAGATGLLVVGLFAGLAVTAAVAARRRASAPLDPPDRPSGPEDLDEELARVLEAETALQEPGRR